MRWGYDRYKRYVNVVLASPVLKEECVHQQNKDGTERDWASTFGLGNRPYPATINTTTDDNFITEFNDWKGIGGGLTCTRKNEKHLPCC